MMNIVLLLNNDIASNLALNLLLPSLKTHNVKVFLSSKVGGNAKRPQALQDLAKFEQHHVYTELERLQTAPKNVTHFKTFAEISKQYGIKIETLNQINSSEGIAIIKSLCADLIVSIRYGVILKSPIITLAKHGVINLHSGLLPDYRGVMATFWAMLNGERELTATLHYIADSTIDTGGIIASAKIKFHQGKSYLWHVISLYVGGCQIIEQAISNISNNSVLGVTEQTTGGNYYSFPSSEQVTDFVTHYGALYEPQEIIMLLGTLVSQNNGRA